MVTLLWIISNIICSVGVSYYTPENGCPGNGPNGI